MNFNFVRFHTLALIILANLPDYPYCAFTNPKRPASQTGESSAYSFSATINNKNRL
jgi:hypothetical protein